MFLLAWKATSCTAQPMRSTQQLELTWPLDHAWQLRLYLDGLEQAREIELSGCHFLLHHLEACLLQCSLHILLPAQSPPQLCHSRKHVGGRLIVLPMRQDASLYTDVSRWEGLHDGWQRQPQNETQAHRQY